MPGPEVVSGSFYSAGYLHCSTKRTPVANAFAECWVGTVRREGLDSLLIFSERHLIAVLTDYVDHYHRPHRSLHQQGPSPTSSSRPHS
ncbi:integrase core domain-containing protein [Parafrankia sp. FMc2]|uniref:integrase core domain-containing protein n=1 Tax=Parafrankia sp. FMc2 TaxID=3233196 RepID=UPI0034D614F5